MPDVYVAPVANKVLNLQNPLEKMNKSDDGNNKGTIFLMDDLNVARKKIMSAVTDNYNKVKFDEKNQPGISNLMSILSKITLPQLPFFQVVFQKVLCPLMLLKNIFLSFALVMYAVIGIFWFL